MFPNQNITEKTLSNHINRYLLQDYRKVKLSQTFQLNTATLIQWYPYPPWSFLVCILSKVICDSCFLSIIWPFLSKNWKTSFFIAGTSQINFLSFWRLVFRYGTTNPPIFWSLFLKISTLLKFAIFLQACTTVWCSIFNAMNSFG